MAKEYGRAIIHTPMHGYHEVPITRSSAGATKTNPEYKHGVQTHAPGWKPMLHKSPQHAIDKLEKHPGFKGWKGGRPDISPADEPEVEAAKRKVRDT